ncbi:cysteine-rich CWC family protein [Saccharicrinis aurantiacus]|uniref:cysteine-rich CWC family protein n=1 Tax=Saccharicrinis aurantiacus TaxID=1849719 RepID=UPI00095013BA
MEKKCANCGTQFTCREDSIIQCHCATVKLNDSARDYLKTKFTGCLCHKCLLEVKQRFVINK